MKAKLFLFMLVASLTAACTSCATVHPHPHRHGPKTHKKVPPGKAKKMAGEKSARYYAPGHRK